MRKDKGRIEELERRNEQLEMEISMKNNTIAGYEYSLRLCGEQAEKLRFQLDEKEERYTQLLEKYTALLDKYRAVMERAVKIDG